MLRRLMQCERERILSGRGRRWTVIGLLLWLAVLAFFVAVFAIDFLVVGYKNSYREWLVVGLDLIRDESGRWHVYDADTRSMDEYVRALADDPGRVARVEVLRDYQRQGAVFHHHEMERWKVRVQYMGHASQGAVLTSNMRRLGVEAMGEQSVLSTAEHEQLVFEDLELSRTPISGRVWSGLLLVIGPMWLVATRKLERVKVPWRLAVRREHLERGSCPNCQYDVSVQLRSGIEVCPECGGSLVIPGVGAARAGDGACGPTG